MDVAAVVTDFDGVHTDDTVLTDADGRESVRVSRSDGMGIAMLRRAGIPVLILSSETNPVVDGPSAEAPGRRPAGGRRQGGGAARVGRGPGASRSPASPTSATTSTTSPVSKLVGYPVAVPEAHPLVLAASRVIVSRRREAHGAVRELADRVLRDRTRSDTALAHTSLDRLRERRSS